MFILNTARIAYLVVDRVNGGVGMSISEYSFFGGGLPSKFAS